MGKAPNAVIFIRSVSLSMLFWRTTAKSESTFAFPSRHRNFLRTVFILFCLIISNGSVESDSFLCSFASQFKRSSLSLSFRRRLHHRNETMTKPTLGGDPNFPHTLMKLEFAWYLNSLVSCCLVWVKESDGDGQRFNYFGLLKSLERWIKAEISPVHVQTSVTSIWRLAFMCLQLDSAKKFRSLRFQRFSMIPAQVQRDGVAGSTHSNETKGTSHGVREKRQKRQRFTHSDDPKPLRFQGWREKTNAEKRLQKYFCARSLAFVYHEETKKVVGDRSLLHSLLQLILMVAGLLGLSVCNSILAQQHQLGDKVSSPHDFLYQKNNNQQQWVKVFRVCRNKIRNFVEHW